MKGTLFELFDIAVPSYFFLVLLGALFATAIGAVWAKRVGHNPDVIVDLGLAGILMGVAGARVLHVIADGFFWDYVHLCTDPSKIEWRVTQAECLADQFSEGWLFGLGAIPHGPLGMWNAAKGVCTPITPADAWGKIDLCLSFAKFWAGGLTYYGGFLGGTLGAYLLLKRDRFPFLKAADMAGIAIPIGIAFGRMGCMLGGCCFGKPWDSHWGISFPPHSGASEAQHRAGMLSSVFESSLPVHPTQLYESAACFAISAVLAFYVHGRKRYDGMVFLWFLVLYAVARFALEFLRMDDRGGAFSLSTSQLISLGLAATAFVMHRVLTSRVEIAPQPQAS